MDRLSSVHTLCSPCDQGKQSHHQNKDFYSCLYFYFDQSVSVVPKSRCALRGPFEAGNEAEVNWRCEGGEKQRFVGIILKTAKKGMCDRVYMHVYIFLDLVLCRYFKFSFGASVTNGIILKLKLCNRLDRESDLPLLNQFGCKPAKANERYKVTMTISLIFRAQTSKDKRCEPSTCSPELSGH